MAALKIAYVNAAAITATLNSLANAAARRAAAVDNSSNLYDDALVQVSITTAAAATSATGYVAVYAYASGDQGTLYETGGATDAGHTLRGDEKLLGYFAAIANSTVYTGVFNVAKAYGGVLPRNWGVIVENRTGAAFAASGNSVNYQGVTYTVA
jgi:hypothetical protein